MGYIPPNENGSPTPTVGGVRTSGFRSQAPTPMPVRGVWSTPNSSTYKPVRQPVKGGTRNLGDLRNLGNKRNMRKSYAAAASRRLAGGR